MPTKVTSVMPAPKSWDEFEDICTDLAQVIWKDPYVQRHGRSGQRQDGVDIYGRPDFLNGDYAGIQCKRVDSLSESKIIKEVNLAAKFTPELTEYHIWTTLNRDRGLQQVIRGIDKHHFRRVDIMFWDDISLRISGNEDLMSKHYPEWGKAKKLGANIIEDDFREVKEFLEKGMVLLEAISKPG